MSEPQGYTQEVVDIFNSRLGKSITEAFTAGEQQERERIIKLLETDPIVNAKDYSDEDIWAFEKAIALIKGER